MARRNGSLVARLWWFLLPATGFFAYPDTTTRCERALWLAPYLLWRAVNRLPFDPFEPMPPIVCTCDECTGAGA